MYPATPPPHKAKQAIELCKSVDEVKKIRDQAQVLIAYAKQQKESLEMQNNIAEIKIRCERRIGEFSKDIEKEKAGRPGKNSHHDGENLTKTKILKEAGLSPPHIHKFEAIADIPEKVFEKHISETKEKKQELTTASVIRVAKHC